MYMRQVGVNFLRRIRILTSYEKPTNILSTSLANSSSRVNHKDSYLWTTLAGPAAIILGINVNPVLADAPNDSSIETVTEGANVIGLRKIEDGSVISNVHTSKWRIFTDNGKEYFLQGKLDEAEKFFLSAIGEAKKGFGNRDPHVASACNNLAELYRVRKVFGKAEPLYLEAINILEESFGSEDIRVGAALHNLGQFYLVQRKLVEARKCYERALKIKGRVLGLGHADYADTMYHLGTEEHPSTVETANALLQCISAYKEFESQRLISDSPELKVEYLSCLKHLSSLISDNAVKERELSGKVIFQELNDEIKRIEGEISHSRKRKI